MTKVIQKITAEEIKKMIVEKAVKKGFPIKPDDIRFNWSYEPPQSSKLTFTGCEFEVEW